MKRTINLKEKKLDVLSPIVMGILNVTPDSFSDGGKYVFADDAVRRAVQMVKEGASIIDIGGYSSRPGAKDVSEQEEMDRVIPIIERITQEMDVPISVDTFRSHVADESIKVGASIVNDISAGSDDVNMIPTVAKHNVPFIAMHKQGQPSNMQNNPQYSNVLEEVHSYLKQVIDRCKSAGIEDVIIDPGFGFGKSISHNYMLLSHLSEFRSLNVPILIGISRKSMIYKSLNIDVKDALNGTTFLHAFSLNNGANILRVHDVKEAVECTELYKLICKNLL
ncbi:MAG: dihydropteroate synthase [Bacteroidia bacterium]|nr:dihydropteroate synthase [Bacteroidia bacterium]